MNASEQEALSDRIMSSWATMKIPPSVWEESLAPFDAGTAGTALIRLRNETKYPPTVAEFIAAIRALGPTGPRRDVHDCTRCGGDGFVTAQQIIHGHEYEVQTPCTCENGDDARSTIGAIVAANDEALNRRLRPLVVDAPYPRHSRPRMVGGA